MRGARGYLVACAAWAAALMLRILLDAVFSSNPFFTPFVPAVALAAWWGGLGPGLLTVALSVLVGAPLWIAEGGGPSGPERWLYVLGAAFTMSLIVLGAELLHRERARSEASRRAETRRANEVAEAARRRDEFVAMLAHELRNPLQALLAAVELLPGDSDEEGRRIREVAQRHGARLGHLLDELLDVARLVQGRMRLRRARTDLAAAVRRAVEAADVTGRGRSLDASYAGGGLALDGDAARLEQLVFNLLDNAVKFTSPGGRIALDTRVEEGHAVVTVEDDGRGVPPALQHEVFEIFAQAEPTLDRSDGGLGLGLFLVRWIAEAHGGHVVLHSEGKGRGTRVRVTLPLAAQDAPAEPVAPASPAPGSRRILVVDDDADCAWSLARLLEIDGHATATATSAPAALERCEDFAPEVVISDIGLPGMDGCELAREIRRRAPDHGPTLVALTGYGDAATRTRLRESGFTHHLLKPVSRERLRDVLAATASEPLASRAG